MREMCWRNWCAYVKHLGVDPYLQQVPYATWVQCLTGFAARTQTGFYGYRRQVQSSTVTSAITAIGQTIALACNKNPTKILGSEKFLPALQIMLDGYTKADPPTQKKLPVEVDVPELLVEMGYGKSESIQSQAIGDLSLIAFYYLLCIGEHTVKRQRDWTKRARKQTVQFKVEDVTFFKMDKHGILQCLPRNAPFSLIMTAESVTLKLDNQKNRWKGVCVHQEANREAFNCPVKALARRVIHIHENGRDQKALLLAIYVEGVSYDVTGDDISKGLKMAATLLNYPPTRGIPIKRVDTHSLRSGGANALAMSGCSDTQIQKMGRWKGAMFKEYIREELACYSAGMSSKMKQNFKFVNISGTAYNDVTGKCLEEDYNINLSMAAVAA
jgi:hypothetical protein